MDDGVVARVSRVHATQERGWLSTEDQIDVLFYDFLNRYQDELIPRYGADALGVESLDTWDIYNELLPLDPRLQKVHPR